MEAKSLGKSKECIGCLCGLQQQWHLMPFNIAPVDIADRCIAAKATLRLREDPSIVSLKTCTTASQRLFLVAVSLRTCRRAICGRRNVAGERVRELPHIWIEARKECWRGSLM